MPQNFQEARQAVAHMAGVDNSFLKAKRKAAEAAEERSFETEVFRELSRLAAGPSSAFEVGVPSRSDFFSKSSIPETMEGTPFASECNTQ